ISNVINNFVKITMNKKATVAQLAYIYNNVIIPKVEYLYKITHLTKNTCHKIERRAIMYIKNRTALPKTTNDNIIFHKGILGIKRLWDNYTESHITSLTQKLNSTGPKGIITEMRLKKAQLLLNSSIPIFKVDMKHLTHTNNLKTNIAITEFIAARSLGINIRVNKDVFNAHIIGSGLTCRDAILANTENYTK